MVCKHSESNGSDVLLTNSCCTFLVSALHVLLSLYWMFNVQAAAVPYEFDLGAVEKRSVDKRRKNKDDDILVKVTGYEMLRDANLNPDLVTPIGKSYPFICSYLFL